jgi:hypothetical protein
MADRHLCFLDLNLTTSKIYAKSRVKMLEHLVTKSQFNKHTKSMQNRELKCSKSTEMLSIPVSCNRMKNVVVKI